MKTKLLPINVWQGASLSSITPLSVSDVCCIVGNVAPSHVISPTGEVCTTESKSQGISFRLALYGTSWGWDLLKLWRSLQSSARHMRHHTWASLGSEVPSILGRTNPYPVPAVLPIWPTQWRPLVKAHLWMQTITLSPSSCSARRGGGGVRGLYNWFLEHTSCFMCLYQSPKEMKGAPPLLPPHLSILLDERTTAKWADRDVEMLLRRGGHINHL